MEPQITAIARVLAAKVPTEGAEDADAVDAWRKCLRYARSSGAIERITELLEAEHPDDPELRILCAELRR